MDFSISASSSASVAPPLPAPPSIRVEQCGEHLSIECRWLTWRVLYLVLMSIIFNVPLAVFSGLMLPGMVRGLPRGGSSFPWWGLIPALVMLVPGVGCLYLTLATLFNRTFIQVAARVLSVRHGPFPWPGRRDIPVEQIDQVYSTIERSGGGRGSTRRYRYFVNALLTDGCGVRLAGGLTKEIQAVYVEWTIQNHLDALGAFEDREGEPLAARGPDARPEVRHHADIPAELMAPPRKVSLCLRCELLTNRLVLFGAGALAVGTILVFTFAGNAVTDLRLAGRVCEASGHLDRVTKTSETRSRGGRGKPTSVYAYRYIYCYEYSFRTPDDVQRHGQSYFAVMATASTPAAPTSSLSIEYAPDHPDASRIKGLATSPSGPSSPSVVIVPILFGTPLANGV